MHLSKNPIFVLQPLGADATVLGNTCSYSKLIGITNVEAIIIPSILNRHLLNLTGKSNNIHASSCSDTDELLWLFSEITVRRVIVMWTRRLDAF